MRVIDAGKSGIATSMRSGGAEGPATAGDVDKVLLWELVEGGSRTSGGARWAAGSSLEGGRKEGTYTGSYIKSLSDTCAFAGRPSEIACLRDMGVSCTIEHLPWPP